MLSILLAAALLQAAPSAAAAAPAPGSLEAAEPPRDNGLPKDDYGLVAWCHGALAGQLELDPIAHKDMEQIEGKAKVAARAKEDAEMVKERRAFLKDYEHALAAAEAASPVAIHQKGVDAELRGFRMWNETRNKAPIWRMLDWGMWDPNDAGCNDAAKRLYGKASLFGEALKGSGDDGKTDAAASVKNDARPEAPAAPLAAPEPATAQASEAPAAAPVKSTRTVTRKTTKMVKTKAASGAPEPAAESAPTPASAPTDTTASANPAETPAAPAKAAPKKAKVARTKPADTSAEAIRDAIAKGKAETEASPATTAPTATPPTADPGLRGPQ